VSCCFVLVLMLMWFCRV